MRTFQRLEPDEEPLKKRQAGVKGVALWVRDQGIGRLSRPWLSLLIPHTSTPLTVGSEDESRCSAQADGVTRFNATAEQVIRLLRGVETEDSESMNEKALLQHDDLIVVDGSSRRMHARSQAGFRVRIDILAERQRAFA